MKKEKKIKTKKTEIEYKDVTGNFYLRHVLGDATLFDKDGKESEKVEITFIIPTGSLHVDFEKAGKSFLISLESVVRAIMKGEGMNP